MNIKELRIKIVKNDLKVANSIITIILVHLINLFLSGKSELIYDFIAI